MVQPVPSTLQVVLNLIKPFENQLDLLFAADFWFTVSCALFFIKLVS